MQLKEKSEQLLLSEVDLTQHWSVAALPRKITYYSDVTMISETRAE